MSRSVWACALPAAAHDATLGTASRLIRLRRQGTFYYVCTDRLGSTVKVVNEDGTGAVSSLWCHAFGADRGSAGTLTVDKRYTGQTADQSIGLYFYQSRYYDPELGGFVSPDTIVPDYKNPQALNRYAYALNNPVRYSDSGGHRAVDQVTPTPQLSTTPAPTPAPALTVTPTPTPVPAAPTATAMPTPALPGPQPVVPGAGGVAMPVSPSPAAAIDWQAVGSQLGQSMGSSASFFLRKTWNRPSTMLGQFLGTASIALGGTVRYGEGTNIAVFEKVQGPAR